MVPGDREVRQGMEVYSADGAKLGVVKRVGKTHFLCDPGVLGLATDLYVPLDAVMRVDRSGVYLDSLRDRVRELGWDRPPEGWDG